MKGRRDSGRDRVCRESGGSCDYDLVLGGFFVPLINGRNPFLFVGTVWNGTSWTEDELRCWHAGEGSGGG